MHIPANKRPEFLEAFVPGLTGAIAAIVLWPVSYACAAATAWLSVGTFLDFWLGALAIITGFSAVVATILAVIGAGLTAFVVAK